MRVFVALAQPPAPQGGAAGRCAWALLQGLRGHGLDVRALAAERPFSAAEAHADAAVALEPLVPEPPSSRTRLRRLARPRSELAGQFAARVAVEAAGADVLHLDELETSWCAEAAPIPSLLHIHYLVEEDRSPGVAWQRSFWRYAEERLAQRLALGRHQALIANSPRVADLLRKKGARARVTVVPLALDPSEYHRSELPGDPVAGLIGTFDWPPTAAAIRELLRDVWPTVQRGAPSARLVIGGRGTERLPPSPSVDVLGPVASSSHFFDRISVLIYPLARGSGMKVKVLEAMASGVPVVTTPLGAEGIAPTDGVVVAATRAELVAAATTLLREPSERAERGRAARTAFQERYTPIAATEPLLGLYEELSASTGAQRRSRPA